MKFSLVIPCYNEAKNLPALVKRCEKLTAARKDIEIILVNNGSKDESEQVLSELLKDKPQIRTVKVEVNQGYGFGIVSGLRAAQGEILGWTHADMQTDPNDALTGLKFFLEAQDPNKIFVKGKRYGRKIADVFFTIGMSAFETLLMMKPMWDINAQPTMFTKKFFDTWFESPHDFSLDLFAYYMAKDAGLEVKRFPVLFANRLHGLSHWNIDWRSKVKFIKRTVDYSLELKKKIDSGE